MTWLFSWIGRFLPDLSPPEDTDQVARRKAELQARFARLSQEVDVIQRVETAEDERE